MSDKKIISLWHGNHPLQKEFDRMWDEYVPAMGDADTGHGEAIRCVGRLNYEYFNNGNCNAAERNRADVCPTCDGDGYEDGETCTECDGERYIQDEGLYMEPYYAKMLSHLQGYVKHTGKVVDDPLYKLKNLITDDELNYNYKYTQEEVNVYNEVATQVIKWVLNWEENQRFFAELSEM